MLYNILNGYSFSAIIMQLLASLLVILIILPLHELAHGYIAYKLGDNTAKMSGRLTLNPMAHLDYVGAACLLLVGFGWANPVPVNPRNFKHPKRDMALVALAGPVSNLLAALVGALLYGAVWAFVPTTSKIFILLVYFLQYYISVNISLAVFNLIPLPPLDGSKILGAFLSDRMYTKLLMNERYLSIILIALVVFNVVSTVISPIVSVVYDFIINVGLLPFSHFL